MRTIFYAKSEDKNRSAQTIAEHTSEVLACFQQFLNSYGTHLSKEEQELVQLACQYHDYGKLNELFQRKLELHQLTIDHEIPHGFLSGFFLDKSQLVEQYGDVAYRALVTAIHYHHIRVDSFTDAEYRAYIETYLNPNVQTYLGISLPISVRPMLHALLFRYPSRNTGAYDLTTWNFYAKIAGILMKCDRAASAGEEIVERPRTSSLTKTILERYGTTLKDAQQWLLEQKNENVVLIAPTGSGKTEGALLWLDDQKGFYTLPLKVASTAIYDRISHTYHDQDTSILHSDTLAVLMGLMDSKKEDRENQEDQATKVSYQVAYQQYLTMKRLSYPLTVCTIDQLFKFPFRSLGFEQVQATLSYSKVIIDEIQMYSSTILACVIYGLGMISSMGGKFAIITATLPRFFLDLLNRYVKEPYQFKTCLGDVPKNRHSFEVRDEDFDFSYLKEQGKTKKILVICNTIKRAKDVYQALQNGPVKGLLHSQFIRRDRREKETQIQKFTKSKETGIWVATQIVEASLDLDFDELHTELAPIDNLLQRFGRCYRSRSYQGTGNNIFIYHNGNGCDTVYDRTLYQLTNEKIRAYQNHLLTEEEKLEMMDAIYDVSLIKDSAYYKNLMGRLHELELCYPMKYDRDEINAIFRDIHNDMILPDSVFEQYKNEIEPLLAILEDSSSNDHYQAQVLLADYLVAVPTYLKLRDRTKLSGTDCYRSKVEYDSLVGISLAPEREGVFC